ncbi:MAG: hypothetical protein OQK69_08645 [Gammaproteobacteria bacterium]|nr:hypothetical protein [Gammaproteobacteria bacterium]
MTEVIFQSGMFTLVMAFIAVAGVMLLLRWIDKITGVPFSSIREVIKRDPISCAVYYGLRFLGVCMLVGQLFS